MRSVSKTLAFLVLLGLVGAPAATGCNIGEGPIGDTAAGISGVGGSCKTASDCQGHLPEFCITCGDGSRGCPHFVCDEGTCTIETCPVAPPVGTTCTDDGLKAAQTVNTQAASYNRAITRDKTGNVTTTTTMAVGTASYVTEQITKTPQSTVMDWVYGPLVEGVQHVHLTSTDGVHFSGTFDTRSATAKLPSSPSGQVVLTFADGKPAPSLVVSSGAVTALQDLETAVSTSKCPAAAATATATPASTSPEGGAILPEGTPVPSGGPSGPVSYPNPTTNDDYGGSPACNNCLNNCNAALVICSSGGAIGCIFAGPWEGFCGAAAMYTCDAVWVACIGPDPVFGAGCQGVGGPCDPGNCGGMACNNGTDTCTSNDTCCPSSNKICGSECCAAGTANDYGCNPNAAGGAGGCCPPDPNNGGWTNPCGPNCCAANEQCADASQGICCPAGLDACAGACCGAGEACANPTGSLQGQPDFCCDSGQTACNGGCCPAGECQTGAITTSGQECCATPLCGGECCNGGSCVNNQCCYGPTDSSGQCCGLADTVVNGSCCAQSQACGSVCCGAGTSCLDAATGQCGTPPNTCTGGLVVCNYGTSSYCCYADQNCNASMPGCCGGSEGPSCIIK